MATLSKFGKLPSARTHDEARAIICCVCWRKVQQHKTSGVVKVVNEKLSNLVRQLVFNGYSVKNPSHPTAMCGNCRLTLCSLVKPDMFKKLAYNSKFIQSL